MPIELDTPAALDLLAHATGVVLPVYFRPDTDPTAVFSLARAAASRDGKGWNGDGDLANIGPDRGLAQIEIVDWDPTISFYTNPRTYEAAVF